MGAHQGGEELTARRIRVFSPVGEGFLVFNKGRASFWVVELLGVTQSEIDIQEVNERPKRQEFLNQSSHSVVPSERRPGHGADPRADSTNPTAAATCDPLAGKQGSLKGRPMGMVVILVGAADGLEPAAQTSQNLPPINPSDRVPRFHFRREREEKTTEKSRDFSTRPSIPFDSQDPVQKWWDNHEITSEGWEKRTPTAKSGKMIRGEFATARFGPKEFKCGRANCFSMESWQCPKVCKNKFCGSSIS